MSKTALCVKKDHLLKTPYLDENNVSFRFLYPNRVLLLDTTLESRPECETNTSLVQLLPYIVLIDPNTDRILSYRRGKASGEDRLKNKCSIGFGGHIEEVSPSLRLDDRQKMLSFSALRELNEELGLEFSYKNYLKIKSIFEEDKVEIFYSYTDEVSKVHLCLLIKMEVFPEELTKLEADIICEPEWLTIKELKHKHNTGERSLEGWSEIALFL